MGCDDRDFSPRRIGIVQHQLLLPEKRFVTSRAGVRASGAAHMAGIAAPRTRICCSCSKPSSSLRTGLAVNR
jgi:hypothetical protein